MSSVASTAIAASPSPAAAPAMSPAPGAKPPAPAPAKAPEASPAPAAAIEDPVEPEKLKLSADQKKKIQGILAEREKEIIGVLTAAQKTKFAEGMKKSKLAVPVLKSLTDLSADQKKKLATIFQASGAKIRAVLTPEQMKQIEAMRSKAKK